MVLDLIVLGVLFFSALVGFFRGLVKEVLTIVGLGGAAAGALLLGGAMGRVAAGWFPAEGKAFNLVPWHYVALGAGYALVFVALLVGLTVLSHFVSRFVHAIGLGAVDRALGVAFGLARGVILIGLLFLPFHIILSDDQKAEYFGNAKTRAYVTYVAELMQALLPSKDVVDHAKGKLKEEKAAEEAKSPEAQTPTPEPAPAPSGSFDPLKGLTGEPPKTQAPKTEGAAKP